MRNFTRQIFKYKTVLNKYSSRFALAVAKWLAGESKEDVRPFIAKHFKVQVVGEITELAASSRLDSYFGQYREVLGIDFEVAKTGKMKGVQAGCSVIAQGPLHLAQHVVRVQTLKSKVCAKQSKIDEYLAASKDARFAGQFVALAKEIADSLAASGSACERSEGSEGFAQAAPALPESIQRAHQMIATCADCLGESVADIMKFYSGNVLEALEDLSKTAKAESVVTLVSMCAEGEFDEEDTSEAMLKLVLGESCQTYYKAFRRLKKVKAGLGSYNTEAAQSLGGQTPD